MILLFLFSSQFLIAQIVESCYIDNSQDLENRLSTNHPYGSSVISCKDIGKDTTESGYSIKLNIKDTEHCASILVYLGYRTLDSRMDEEYYGVCFYDQLKLNHELQVGSKYKISMRLFCENISLSDSSYFKNSGILLSNEKVKFLKDNMIETSNILPFGEIPTEEWYTKEWVIQPTCQINYLTFGSFRNGDWPASIYYEGGRSFLVESYQIELLNDNYTGNINNYYCFKIDNINKANYNKLHLEFYYRSDDYTLTKDQNSKLDSLAIMLMNNPNVIIGIEGFADSKGKNNELLSEKRVTSIKSYLMQSHNIPSIRILEFPKSDIDAMQNNGNDISDIEFRKTVVYRSELSPKNLFYRKLIESSKMNEKKSWLDKWLLLASLDDKIVLYFNSCFNHETNDLFKPVILARIFDEYSHSKIPLNCFVLDSLIYEDQSLITFNHDIQRLYGYDRNDPHDLIRDCDDFSLDLRDSTSQKKNYSNQLALSKFIDIHGWPNHQKYDAKRISDLSLILVHQSEINILIENSLFLKPICEKGLAPWNTYALILDKISKLKNEPQLYGTQWQLGKDNITLKIYNHVDEDILCNARDKLGLPNIDLSQKVKFKR